MWGKGVTIYNFTQDLVFNIIYFELSSILELNINFAPS